MGVPHVHHSLLSSAAVDIFAACTTLLCLIVLGGFAVLVLSKWWRCSLNLHLSDLKRRHLRTITDLIKWLLAFWRHVIWHLFSFVSFFFYFFAADCHVASHPFNWWDHIQNMLSVEMTWRGLTRWQTCVCFVYKIYSLFYHWFTYHILSSFIMHLIICPWDSGRKKSLLMAISVKLLKHSMTNL